MARDERDRKTDEDLFEDLDQFFAPLDETDWPEEAGTPVAGSEPPPVPEPPAERPSARPSERPGPERPPDADIEDLEELEIDLPDEEPAAAEAVATEEPAPAPPQEPPAAPAPPPRDEEWDREQEEDWIASATADMAGEDWELGAEAGAEQPPGGPPAEGSGPAEPPAPTGGERPLSVDDLRTPPPQYADLPGPEEEEPVLAEEATMEDLEAPLAVEEEGLPEEVVPVAAAEIVEEVAPPPEPEVPPEEEEVEAAAEHFASGLGEPDAVQRDILSDLEPDTRTAPIDREAVMDRAAAETEPEPEGGEPAPAWESEGTHAAVTTAEEGAPPTERNLVAAMVTGILLAAAVIALLAIGKGPFAVLAGAVILLGQGELYAVMRRRGYHPATLLGLVAGGFIVAGAYIKGPSAILLGLSLSMILAVLWYMAAPPNARKGTLRDAAVTIFGIVYVPFMAGFALLLLGAPGDVGRNIFLAVVGLTILYDVCAYAIGSLWGSRPLAASISPRKSWEGAIGATFVLLLAALAIVPSIDPFTAGSAVGLALVIAVTAPFGDLVESAIKRDMGVKDMSGLLPGHGGILDRIDALLFTCPAAYWFLLIALSP